MRMLAQTARNWRTFITGAVPKFFDNVIEGLEADRAASVQSVLWSWVPWDAGGQRGIGVGHATRTSTEPRL